MPRFIANIPRPDEGDLASLNKRFDLVTLAVISAAALLIARLWFLQIHRGPEYKHLSENNRLRLQYIAAPRGNILDKKNRILVTNRPCFNVVWFKEDSPDPAAVIKRMANILALDTSDLLNKVRAAVDQPRYLPILLQEDIDWKTLVYIENHKFELPGIRIKALARRNYILGNLASHLIGYLGTINEKDLKRQGWQDYRIGDRIGKSGIEQLFENYLHGEDGRRYVEVNARGFEQQELEVQEPLPGNDLYLSIDSDLQDAAEQAMTGKSGAVVAMEVGTGRILVLCSSPPLLLTDFVGGIPAETWRSMRADPLKPFMNKAIQGQYPPGSIYKIITALAALSEKAITPETIVYCNGSIMFGNRRYRCWKHSGHGAIALQRALAESCDVFFYDAGLKVGVDTLARYAESLGLGRKTGIVLNNERPGLIPTSQWKKQKLREAWQEGETLSISIGQGFDLVTPLQICRMMEAVANGGTLHRPIFVTAVKDPAGKTIQQFNPIQEGGLPGAGKWLSLIRKALVAAVNDKHGTGGMARMEGITVAGKTGTSQVVRRARYKGLKGEDIPYRYRDHAWFSCFAPAEAPEIVVTVLVEHGGHGGSAAAPIAKSVLTRYFGDRGRNGG